MKKPKKLIWVCFFKKPTKKEVNELLIEYGRKTAYMFTDSLGCYTFRAQNRPGIDETFKKLVKLI